MNVVPMFPLGLVHFPFVFLPLQVFEPRYRQLTIDCLEGSREFGVVLIERGSEVGGGDVRFDVGTMTTIVDAGFNSLGFVRLDTVGTRRVRVIEWLEDDPYPRAEVVDFTAPSIGSAEASLWRETEALVRRALVMRSELNEPGPSATMALDDDPSRALFQLAAIAPISAVDQQRVLACEAPREMLALLRDLVAEEVSVFAQRLAGN